MASPSRGIWVDDPVAEIRKSAFWDRLVEHKLSTAALMLESLGGGFDPRYGRETLEVVRDLAFARDVEIVLTVWPEPSKAYLAELEERIGPLLVASGASALELDAEGNWLGRQVRDFADLDAAGDELVAVFGRIRAAHDVRVELTTYPFHRENSRAADLAPHADRLLPQAYSVRNRSEGPVEWDAKHGPGGMQRLTLDRARQVPGAGAAKPRISCGLAAYDQAWPGRSAEEAMQVAWDAACAYDPVEVRWWSSKWVFGKKKNGYSSRFLRQLP